MEVVTDKDLWRRTSTTVSTTVLTTVLTTGMQAGNSRRRWRRISIEPGGPPPQYWPLTGRLAGRHRLLKKKNNLKGFQLLAQASRRLISWRRWSYWARCCCRWRKRVSGALGTRRRRPPCHQPQPVLSGAPSGPGPTLAGASSASWCTGNTHTDTAKAGVSSVQSWLSSYTIHWEHKHTQHRLVWVAYSHDWAHTLYTGNPHTDTAQAGVSSIQSWPSSHLMHWQHTQTQHRLMWVAFSHDLVHTSYTGNTHTDTAQDGVSSVQSWLSSYIVH